jgi:hypothetical protein
MSKIYLRKFEQILQGLDSKYSLQRCAYCNKLFSLQSQDKLVCSKAKIFIDFHGSVIAKHMADRAFDFKKFIGFVMSKKLFDNRTLFWRIIAWSLMVRCLDCEEWFHGAQIYDCRFHPCIPIFPQVSINEGFYPCCHKKALRFDTSMKIKGC